MGMEMRVDHGISDCVDVDEVKGGRRWLMLDD